MKMNKRMKKDREKLIKTYFPGSKIEKEKIIYTQKFLFPELKDYTIKKIEEMVIEKEKIRKKTMV